MAEKQKESLLHRIAVALHLDAPPVEDGLHSITEHLGLDGSAKVPAEYQPSAISVLNTEDVPRSIYYAPDMDGQPEPGEVVWVWAPSDGPDKPLRDRAVLVVGHNRHSILGLLISPNPTHADDDLWLDIGTGEWDPSGRQCWVRLDRLLEVEHSDIRRQGTLFPRRRFQRVAAKLRNRFGWS